MIRGRILLKGNKQVLFSNGMRTKNAWDRAKGLLGFPQLRSNECLWLEPCNSVHMFGMRQSLDIVYLAGDGQVLKVVNGLKPWRVSLCLGASSVLEVRAGMCLELGVLPGSYISWSNDESQ